MIKHHHGAGGHHGGASDAYSSKMGNEGHNVSKNKHSSSFANSKYLGGQGHGSQSPSLTFFKETSKKGGVKKALPNVKKFYK